MCGLFTMLARLCGRCKRVRHEVTFLQYLYVDHDHRTGRVRGLLCNACNTAIGLFEESRPPAGICSHLSRVIEIRPTLAGLLSAKRAVEKTRRCGARPSPHARDRSGLSRHHPACPCCRSHVWRRSGETRIARRAALSLFSIASTPADREKAILRCQVALNRNADRRRIARLSQRIAVPDARCIDVGAVHNAEHR